VQSIVMSMSVCPCVLSHNSKTTRLNCTVHVVMARFLSDSVAIHYVKKCMVDHVMFSQNCPMAHHVYS